MSDEVYWIQRMLLENTSSVEAPEKPPEEDHWLATYPLRDDNLLAGVALQLPGDIVQAALEGKERFGQP